MTPPGRARSANTCPKQNASRAGNDRTKVAQVTPPGRAHLVSFCTQAFCVANARNILLKDVRSNSAMGASPRWEIAVEIGMGDSVPVKVPSFWHVVMISELPLACGSASVLKPASTAYSTAFANTCTAMVFHLVCSPSLRRHLWFSRRHAVTACRKASQILTGPSSPMHSGRLGSCRRKTPWVVLRKGFSPHSTVRDFRRFATTIWKADVDFPIVWWEYPNDASAWHFT